MAKLRITKGDKVTLQLKVKHLGQYHDLTGATLETRIAKSASEDIVIPNASHTIDPDQVTNKGLFSLLVDSVESAQFLAGGYKNIVTKVTQGGTVFYVHGRGILEVLNPEAFR